MQLGPAAYDRSHHGPVVRFAWPDGNGALHGRARASCRATWRTAGAATTGTSRRLLGPFQRRGAIRRSRADRTAETFAAAMAARGRYQRTDGDGSRVAVRDRTPQAGRLAAAARRSTVCARGSAWRPFPSAPRTRRSSAGWTRVRPMVEDLPAERRDVIRAHVLDGTTHEIAHSQRLTEEARADRRRPDRLQHAHARPRPPRQRRGGATAPAAPRPPFSTSRSCSTARTSPCPTSTSASAGRHRRLQRAAGLRRPGPSRAASEIDRDLSTARRPPRSPAQVDGTRPDAELVAQRRRRSAPPGRAPPLAVEEDVDPLVPERHQAGDRRPRPAAAARSSTRGPRAGARRRRPTSTTRGPCRGSRCAASLGCSSARTSSRGR